MLLEKAKYGKSVLRAVLLLPWVVPASMSVLAWQWMFDPTYSLINWILVQLGGKAISWLGSPFWARTAVITINVWRGIPFFAIGFTAGLTSIPIELYESASMDGAGEIRKFFRITLPLLMPVFSIILLYSIVQTISDFETIFILTRGGPMESTHLLGTVAFFIGLAGTELGKGAAISLFIFPVLFMAAFFAIRTVIKNENF
jgi:multiple sugar transport system permease protein